MTDSLEKRQVSSNERLRAALEAVLPYIPEKEWIGGIETGHYRPTGEALLKVRQQIADALASTPETRCVGCGGTLVRPELCDECFLAQKPDENGRTPCPSCGNDTQHGPHMPGCRRANAQKAAELHPMVP